MKKARIEIIPMIDTIFFLLVFFMITSLSMVQMSAHKVNLPDSSTAHEKPLEKVVVSISKEGEYYVDRRPVLFAAIEPYLEEKIHDNPSIVVVINCDKDQSVETFLRTMDIIKQANPASLLIATAPKNAAEANQ
jgi:biopolymer transport protein ExbD